MRQVKHTRRHLYIGIFMFVISALALISAFRTGFNFSILLIVAVFAFMGWLFFKTYFELQKQWAEERRQQLEFSSGSPASRKQNVDDDEDDGTDWDYDAEEEDGQ